MLVAITKLPTSQPQWEKPKEERKRQESPAKEERRERRREEKKEVQQVYKAQEQERLPESSEVVILQHTEHLHNPVARGLGPGAGGASRAHASEASRAQLGASRAQSRVSRALNHSTRGLKRLQDTLSSNLSSLYVNESFEDGRPCRVRGCPLNPTTRVRHKLPACS